jgi:hypothetical protein
VTAQAFQADVGCSEQADELIAQVLSAFGRIDSLVCNAGIGLRELFDKTTDAQWEKLLRVNVSGAFYCCRAVLPHMLHRKKGRIVIVSSIWGITGASCELAYSASKGGASRLTKGLAKEGAVRHHRELYCPWDHRYRYESGFRRNRALRAPGGNAARLVRDARGRCRSNLLLRVGTRRVYYGAGDQSQRRICDISGKTHEKLCK